MAALSVRRPLWNIKRRDKRSRLNQAGKLVVHSPIQGPGSDHNDLNIGTFYFENISYECSMDNLTRTSDFNCPLSCLQDMNEKLQKKYKDVAFPRPRINFLPPHPTNNLNFKQTTTKTNQTNHLSNHQHEGLHRSLHPLRHGHGCSRSCWGGSRCQPREAWLRCRLLLPGWRLLDQPNLPCWLVRSSLQDWPELLNGEYL